MGCCIRPDLNIKDNDIDFVNENIMYNKTLDLKDITIESEYKADRDSIIIKSILTSENAYLKRRNHTSKDSINHICNNENFPKYIFEYSHDGDKHKSHLSSKSTNCLFDTIDLNQKKIEVAYVLEKKMYNQSLEKSFTTGNLFQNKSCTTLNKYKHLLS